MTRRNNELLLLCLAAPFVVLLFSMVLVDGGVGLSLETLAVPLGLFGAFVLAHLATRFFAKNADPAVLPIVFGLSGIGIAFVTRLAPDLAMSQIMWLFLGIAAMIATLAIARNLDKARAVQVHLHGCRHSAAAFAYDSGPWHGSARQPHLAFSGALRLPARRNRQACAS